MALFFLFLSKDSLLRNAFPNGALFGIKGLEPEGTWKEKGHPAGCPFSMELMEGTILRLRRRSIRHHLPCIRCDVRDNRYRSPRGNG